MLNRENEEARFKLNPLTMFNGFLDRVQNETQTDRDMQFLTMQRILLSGVMSRKPTTVLGKQKAAIDEANEWFDAGYTLDKALIQGQEDDYRRCMQILEQ